MSHRGIAIDNAAVAKTAVQRAAEFCWKILKSIGDNKPPSVMDNINAENIKPGCKGPGDSAWSVGTHKNTM